MFKIVFFVFSLFIIYSNGLSLDKIKINGDVSSFIFNGTVADITEFPHQIALFGISIPDEIPQFVCGGSILQSQWILTAAHCVRDDIRKMFSNFKVFAGNNSLLNYQNDPNGIKVKDILIHPDSDGSGHDLALLKLEKPIQLNGKTIKPACLLKQPSDKLKPFDNLVATGFGLTTNEKAAYGRLLEKTKVLEDLSFHKNGTNKYPKYKWIRTGKEGSSTPCSGDSGGPLNFKDKSGQNYVVGVVSKAKVFFIFCLGEALYARVSLYLDWIQNTVDQPICIGDGVY